MAGQIVVDLEALTRFTHQEVLHDSLVKRSIEEGYMTEAELLIARYVQEHCNLQCPEEGGEDQEEEEADERRQKAYEQRWQGHLPAAYEAAAQQFSVTPQRAQELYRQSLEIRNRIIQRIEGA